MLDFFASWLLMLNGFLECFTCAAWLPVLDADLCVCVPSNVYALQYTRVCITIYAWVDYNIHSRVHTHTRTHTHNIYARMSILDNMHASCHTYNTEGLAAEWRSGLPFKPGQLSHL